MAHIVVADDEPDLLLLMTATLRHAGHDVVAAANGREALDAVRLQRPDLVVTDHSMPVMTGAQLCQALALDPATAGIPVLMVSGSIDVSVSPAVPGVVAYVLKPFRPFEILDAVDRVLSRTAVRGNGG